MALSRSRCAAGLNMLDEPFELAPPPAGRHRIISCSDMMALLRKRKQGAHGALQWQGLSFFFSNAITVRALSPRDVPLLAVSRLQMRNLLPRSPSTLESS